MEAEALAMRLAAGTRSRRLTWTRAADQPVYCTTIDGMRVAVILPAKVYDPPWTLAQVDKYSGQPIWAIAADSRNRDQYGLGRAMADVVRSLTAVH